MMIVRRIHLVCATRMAWQRRPRQPTSSSWTQPTARLHSQLDHGAVSRDAKINGHEPVKINPRDATARDIKDGDIVRL